jgi:hypothetical protein
VSLTCSTGATVVKTPFMSKVVRDCGESKSCSSKEMPCSMRDFLRILQLGQTGSVYTFTVCFVSDVIRVAVFGYLH